ncbi:hypothetical protein [Geodermatophilus nigrescens]|uniref:Uncharacterized protein n=1 Tax=Geodermatophilus nigrescens TaxID=1070870 RepID=A0A1M5G2F3_9ACTN|nr:hypothetical protein [Geodermatophilus nigrescens]SHF98007.1 hypothetical protein SAMN05444351_1520 [Geodermatophilus nigrescens]
MPYFRTVEVYPTSGWWGTRWHEHDRDGDAFAKVSRGICDAYSASLGDDAVPHTVSTLRIFIDTDGRLVRVPVDPRRTVVVSPTFTDRVWEGFESAAVRVVPGFADLALAVQRRVVLQAVHAAARGLASFRGLDPSALEAARQAVIDADFVFTWASEWKSSPGRRWRARCVFRTMPDGFGRLVLEVTDGDGTKRAASPEQVAFTTVEGYRRAARTLRWSAADRLEVVPCVDPFGDDAGSCAVAVDEGVGGAPRLTVLQSAGLPGRPDAAVEEPSSTPEPVETDRRSAERDGPEETVLLVVPDPAERRILGIGGGPTNDVPELYWRTLHDLFDRLDSPEWAAWWAPSSVPTLQLSWWADVAQDRLFVRRGKDKVIARIERTPTGLREVDPVQAARDDLEGLLALVQRRMSLAVPPALS